MKLAQLIAQTGEQEATIQVLCHLLEAERTNVFLVKDISDSIAEQTIKIINQYKNGTPLAYLLGSTYFYNRKFLVTKDVLVPRHDTEVLVELTEKKIKWFSVKIKTTWTDTNKIATIFIKDITLEEENRQKMREYTEKDSVTLLPNKLKF
ncbi:MAG: hypothetical protein IKT33_04160, partial [Clostridia bacterium]|nr:hypothetical protein [Clostridia bacterium]